MSTIKIDRGFTQKIHAQELRHTQIPHPVPEPPKKESGGSKRKLIAVGGGALLALVAVVVAVAVASKGPKKKPAAPQEGPVVLDARPLRPAAKPPEPAKPPEAAKPPVAAPAEVAAKPAAPSPEAKPAAQPPPPAKPILREVPLGSPNGLRCDYYEHVNGWQLSQLKSAPAYPAQPSRTVQIGRFELSEKLGENYGARVRGYLVPPKSGAYRFAVCVDDSAELWLSADDAPEHLRKLVTVGSHVSRNWTEKAEQQSAPCELVGGNRYYVEALMKQGSGSDYLLVGWSGPVSEKFVTVDAAYLQPWTDAPAQKPAAVPDAADRRKARESREAALAPARAAIAEQQRLHAKALRFKEAAAGLKEAKKTWEVAEAQALVDAAAQRFETLAQLRPFLQKELQRARPRGVWTAFGGQADVTGVSDEGVTVAPGRIVAWDKIPPDQMLRLVNATLLSATLDPASKGSLCLAAALFCKEVSGGLDMAFKYRERAIALNSKLGPQADRLLGGTPEAILAQPRVQASREELARAAAAAADLAAKAVRLESDFGSVTGRVAGLTVEFWENVTCKNLDEVRKQGVTTKTPPNSTLRITDFATPESHGEKYVARVKGYLVPSESGEYLFYIAADDQGELWLSPDENPDRAALCVKIDVPVGRQQWDKDKRKSKPVELVKGKRYFVKALLREGERGDHLSVAWSLASENAPRLITAENLVCASSAGLPAAAEELRRKIGDDLQRAQSLAAEAARLLAEDEALAERQAPASNQMAGDLKRQAERAKEVQRELETLVAGVEASLPQLKAALQPDGGKAAK